MSSVTDNVWAVYALTYCSVCQYGGEGGVELPWTTNQPSLTFNSTVNSSPTCNSKSLTLFPLNAVTTRTLCSAVVIFCFARFFSFIRFLRTRSRCERKLAVIVHTLCYSKCIFLLYTLLCVLCFTSYTLRYCGRIAQSNLVTINTRAVLQMAMFLLSIKGMRLPCHPCPRPFQKRHPIVKNIIKPEN